MFFGYQTATARVRGVRQVDVEQFSQRRGSPPWLGRLCLVAPQVRNRTRLLLCFDLVAVAEGPAVAVFPALDPHSDL